MLVFVAERSRQGREWVWCNGGCLFSPCHDRLSHLHFDTLHPISTFMPSPMPCVTFYSKKKFYSGAIVTLEIKAKLKDVIRWMSGISPQLAYIMCLYCFVTTIIVIATCYNVHSSKIMLRIQLYFWNTFSFSSDSYLCPPKPRPTSFQPGTSNHLY